MRRFDPTPEGWEEFRRAIRETLAAVERDPDGEHWYPVLGNTDYWFRPPGRTEIAHVCVTDDALSVSLKDGRRVEVPLSWFPILRDARQDERMAELWYGGQAVHFPLLNMEVTLDQILAIREFFHETALLNQYVSSDKLAFSAAVLIWRLASERKIPVQEALEIVWRELDRWSPPDKSG